MTIHVVPDVTVLFLLLFARTAALVMLMPGIGEPTINTRVRLSLALLLTLIFYPIMSNRLPQGLTSDMDRVLFALVGAILIGVGIGLLARLSMTVVQIAGTAIASDIGLGFAQSVDPTMGQQGAIVSSFLSVVAVTLIFTTNLYQMALVGIADSYKLFPPGGALPLADFRDAAVMTIADSFKIGLQIAAPFMAFSLVFNLGLGVLQKLMPQFQVYFLAMPATILLGLVVLAFLISVMMHLYQSHLETALMRFVSP